MAERRPSAGSSALNAIAQFNAGVVDNTLGLLDLGAQGVAGISNMITGRNDRPVMLGQRAKSALNVESDPSSPSYIAGSVAPAVATGVGTMAKQGLTSIRNFLGNTSTELGGYFGGEAGAQIGREYGGDYGEMAGSLVGGMAAPNTTRSDIFAGPSSKTADQEALFRANQMERQGASPEEIKQATGFQKNLDGEYMYHIPDNKSALNFELMKTDIQDLMESDRKLAESMRTELGAPRINSFFQRPLGEVLDHKELYEAYPDLYNMPVSYRLDTERSNSGSFDPRAKDITLEFDTLDVREPQIGAKVDFDSPNRPTPVTTPSRQGHSTLLHEINHAVSNIEGRSTGGSPETASSQMIAAERVEQEPFFTDYVNYNEADKGIRDINRDLSLRDLQDIGNRGDIDELINHHLFKMNEGRLTAELGDLFASEDMSEWARQAAEMTVEDVAKNLDSLTLRGHINRRNLSRDELLTAREMLSENKQASAEGYRKHQEIGQKYGDLNKRTKGAYDKYLLMNDEFLSRTVQNLMDDPRSTYDIPLYRDVPDPRMGNLSTDDLFNSPNPYVSREALDINDLDEDQYIQAINPQGTRIAPEARPNLGMGDMYGMAPRNAEEIMTQELRSGDTIRYVQDGDAVYALGYNPDLGEEDVVGYMLGGGDGSELAVVDQMQGQGIGGNLSYLYRSQNPMAQSGGFTEAGEAAARQAYRRMMGYE